MGGCLKTCQGCRRKEERERERPLHIKRVVGGHCVIIQYDLDIMRIRILQQSTWLTYKNRSEADSVMGRVPHLHAVMKILGGGGSISGLTSMAFK